MQGRVPVVVMVDVAAVGPVHQDLTHCGVLDACAFLDGPVGEAVGSEGEDVAHDVGVVAGHQGAVDHAVSGGRPVEVSAGLHSVGDGSGDVLDDVISVVLGEHAMDTELHAT